MFDWKVENMALMNERGHIIIGGERIYSPETSTSRKDKIAFVDFMQDGRLSYLLSLIDKFNEDSKTMPKDSWGKVKTVSLKAWIKHNDTKYSQPILNTVYNHGGYYLLGMKRSILYNHKGQFDHHEDIVDEAFHRQLKLCEGMEREYFATHDESSILRAMLVEKYNQFRTTFGVRLGFSGPRGVKFYDESGRERELTIEELKHLIAKYDELEAYIAKLSSEINIEY